MPARFRDIARAIRACGVEIFTRTGKGSHVVLYDSQGRTYPVSLSNGDKTELSDVYLRGICRKFGIDFDALKSNL